MTFTGTILRDDGSVAIPTVTGELFIEARTCYGSFDLPEGYVLPERGMYVLQLWLIRAVAAKQT
jgi:hypothetical protein